MIIKLINEKLIGVAYLKSSQNALNKTKYLQSPEIRPIQSQPWHPWEQVPQGPKWARSHRAGKTGDF